MPLVYAQAFFLFLFYPQQDCVMYLSGTGVIEMWPSSLSLSFGICFRFSQIPPSFHPARGLLGLQEWSSWSILQLPWQRVFGCCVTVSPPKWANAKESYLIFLSSRWGSWLNIWRRFTVFHTSALKTISWSYFVWFHKFIHTNWSQYFFLEEELHFMVELLFFFFICTLYMLRSQGLHILTKHQHPSLEFIVDVVLLLWVATKIVMSCPHRTVTSSSGAPACGRGFFTKEYNAPLILMIVHYYIIHSKLQTWRNLVISCAHNIKNKGFNLEVLWEVN